MGTGEPWSVCEGDLSRHQFVHKTGKVFMKTRALSISPSVAQQLCGDEIKATRRSVIEGFDRGIYIGPAKRAEVVTVLQ